MASIKDRIATSTNSVLNGKELIANSITNNLGVSASKAETFNSLASKIVTDNSSGPSNIKLSKFINIGEISSDFNSRINSLNNYIKTSVYNGILYSYKIESKNDAYKNIYTVKINNGSLINLNTRTLTTKEFPDLTLDYSNISNFKIYYSFIANIKGTFYIFRSFIMPTMGKVKILCNKLDMNTLTYTSMNITYVGDELTTTNNNERISGSQGYDKVVIHSYYYDCYIDDSLIAHTFYHSNYSRSNIFNSSISKDYIFNFTQESIITNMNDESIMNRYHINSSTQTTIESDYLDISGIFKIDKIRFPVSTSLCNKDGILFTTGIGYRNSNLTSNNITTLTIGLTDYSYNCNVAIVDYAMIPEYLSKLSIGNDGTSLSILVDLYSDDVYIILTGKKLSKVDSNLYFQFSSKKYYLYKAKLLTSN